MSSPCFSNGFIICASLLLLLQDASSSFVKNSHATATRKLKTVLNTAQLPAEVTVPTSHIDPETQWSFITSSFPAARLVPNSEVGVYIVVAFLLVAGFVVLGWLMFIIVRQRRRRYYRQPGRNSRLRTDSSAQIRFENPIQFPPGNYGNAVI